MPPPDAAPLPPLATYAADYFDYYADAAAIACRLPCRHAAAAAALPMLCIALMMMPPMLLFQMPPPRRFAANARRRRTTPCHFRRCRFRSICCYHCRHAVSLFATPFSLLPRCFDADAAATPFFYASPCRFSIRRFQPLMMLPLFRYAADTLLLLPLVTSPLRAVAALLRYQLLIC